MNLTLQVGISTRDLASLVPGRDSDPSGEISLSYMDIHNGLLYSPILKDSNDLKYTVDNCSNYPMLTVVHCDVTVAGRMANSSESDQTAPAEAV